MTEKVEAKIKNTVGYSEAVNKRSFMAGAGVGYGKAEDEFKEQIESLNRQLTYAKKAAETYLKDLKSISAAFNTVKYYSENG